MPKIFINVGHWPYAGAGYDPGAVNRTGVQIGGWSGQLEQLTEAAMVRLIASKVRTRLEAEGYEVIVFGDPTLRGIVDKANASNADVFVSLHCNALNGKARGVEIFTNRFDTKALPLAHAIYNEIKWSQRNLKRSPLYWRGEKKAGFYVIKYTTMPAVLVEMGFIDNDVEAREMVTLSWQNAMADAIANGIKIYFDKKDKKGVSQ